MLSALSTRILWVASPFLVLILPLFGLTPLRLAGHSLSTVWIAHPFLTLASIGIAVGITAGLVTLGLHKLLGSDSRPFRAHFWDCAIVYLLAAEFTLTWNWWMSHDRPYSELYIVYLLAVACGNGIALGVSRSALGSAA